MTLLLSSNNCQQRTGRLNRHKIAACVGIMLLLQLMVSLGLLVLVSAEEFRLQLNPNSTIISDVKSITHNTELRELVIDLRISRRCDNPSFRVRLSGQSLYILDLVSHEHTPLVIKAAKQFFYPRSSVYRYSYPPLLDEGTYFIEVLSLFCTTFDPNSYKDVCLENVHEGRSVLNMPYSFSNSATSVPTGETIKRPRWVLGDSSVKPKLLPTRYQTRNCGEGVYCDATWEELAQHRLYSWVDKPDWVAPLTEVLKVNQPSSTNTATIPEAPVTTPAKPLIVNICFFGASHARELMLHGFGLSDTEGKVLFIWIESKYSYKFQVQQLQEHACTFAVIGYGQWPVSYYEPVTYSADRYAKEMRAMMQLISGSAYHGLTKVYMVSTNYNALGGIITACPPADHRSPPVIDMLNSVVGTLANELQVGYIDLNHIMGPMWDSAQDYCHPKGKVFTAEVEWILHQILSDTVKSKQPVTLYPGNPPYPENSLIRFTDGNTVYLKRDGVLRAFPNGRTFMAMGFDFGDVQVELDWKRGLFKFGPDLPGK